MRRSPISIVAAATLGLAQPAMAQDQAPPAAADDPDRIAFDLGAVADDDNGDWGISSFLADSEAAERASCATDSDLLAVQSTSRPRYDQNGTLIREAPAAACVPPGSRYGEEAATLRVQDQRRASPGNTSALLRQPDCVENSTGYACSSAGSNGRTGYERQQQCEESGTTRSCSFSFSIGTSEGARNAAQDAIDRLRED